MLDKVLRRKIRLILFGPTLFLEFSLLLLIMHRNKFLHKIFPQPCNYCKTFNVWENARIPETLSLSIKALVLLSAGMRSLSPTNYIKKRRIKFHNKSFTKNTYIIKMHLKKYLNPLLSSDFFQVLTKDLQVQYPSECWSIDSTI